MLARLRIATSILAKKKLDKFLLDLNQNKSKLIEIINYDL